jgi:hypothetical protein
VDDMLSGVDTVADAIILQNQLLSMMSRGCFSLRKWSFKCFNSAELLQRLPKDMVETSPTGTIDFTDQLCGTQERSVKCLGTIWNVNKDLFEFKVPLQPSSDRPITKRSILTQIARLFDPLGWLSPVIIVTKIDMQDLWKLKCNCDEPLPRHTQEQWSSFTSNLSNLAHIYIPRCIKPRNTLDIDIAGFCYSSEAAYAAAVYLCAYPSSEIPVISLVMARPELHPTSKSPFPVWNSVELIYWFSSSHQ